MGILTIIGLIVTGLLMGPFLLKVVLMLVAGIWELLSGVITFAGELVVFVVVTLLTVITDGWKQIKKMHKHKRKYGRSL